MLYVLAGAGLIRCAMVSSQHGDVQHTALFGGAAALFAFAIAHHGYHRDELRAARVQLELAARPRDHQQATEDAVAIAMAAACCERWWTSAGAEHDPQSCSRKDLAA
jgi:hypothetical protein